MEADMQDETRGFLALMICAVAIISVMTVTLTSWVKHHDRCTEEAKKICIENKDQNCSYTAWRACYQ